MKGFLKRDLSLLMLNLRFYLLFLFLLAGLAAFTDFSTTFTNLYGMIFCASSLLGLFSYDEANHWQAYAAAAPDGRRAQVQARYLLGLLTCGGMLLLLLLVAALGRKPGWEPETVSVVLLYGGLFLLYTAVIFPLSYFFGQRNRLVLIILIALLGGGIGAGSGIFTITSSFGREYDLLTAISPLLLAVGLAAMAVSYPISLFIMTKKEL